MKRNDIFRLPSILKVFLILVSIAFSSKVLSQVNHFKLDHISDLLGYKLMTIVNTSKDLKKTDKLIKHDDLNSYVFYKGKSHLIVSLTNKKSIFSVQVTGPSPYAGESIYGLKLGDKVSKVGSVLGTPSEKIKQEEKYGVEYKYKYLNLTLEVKDKKIRSMRIFTSNDIFMNNYLDEEGFSKLKKSKNKIKKLLTVSSTAKEMGMLSTSVRLYNRILELDPKNIEALVNKANSLTDLDESLLALNAYHRAYKIDPENISILYNLARLLSHMQEYEKAESIFRSAKEKISTKIDNDLKGRIIVGLANSLDEQKKYKEANSLYMEAKDIEGHYENALYNHAISLFSQGKKKMAISHLKKIKKESPFIKDAKKLINKYTEIK